MEVDFVPYGNAHVSTHYICNFTFFSSQVFAEVIQFEIMKY